MFSLHAATYLDGGGWRVDDADDRTVDVLILIHILDALVQFCFNNEM